MAQREYQIGASAFSNTKIAVCLLKMNITVSIRTIYF